MTTHSLHKKDHYVDCLVVKVPPWPYHFWKLGQGRIPFFCSYKLGLMLSPYALSKFGRPMQEVALQVHFSLHIPATRELEGTQRRERAGREG